MYTNNKILCETISQKSYIWRTKAQLNGNGNSIFMERASMIEIVCLSVFRRMHKIERLKIKLHAVRHITHITHYQGELNTLIVIFQKTIHKLHGSVTRFVEIFGEKICACIPSDGKINRSIDVCNLLFRFDCSAIR